MQSLFRTELDAKTDDYFPPKTLNEIYKSIDSSPEMYGAGVVFVPGEAPDILRMAIFFEEKANKKVKVLRESCRADGKIIFIRELLLPKNTTPSNQIQKTRSTLGRELEGAGWSCTSAAIGWGLVIAEAGGGTVSVGVTWTLMPLTLAATSASTLQCGVAIGRSINSIGGRASQNEWLDQSPVYSSTMMVLDIVQVADVAQTLGKQAVLYRLLKQKGVSSGGMLKMYQQLPRASRKRLAEELIKLDHPALTSGSRKMLKQVMNGTRLLEDGTKVSKVYTQTQVRSLLNTKIVELIGSAITVKGSAGGAYDVSKKTIGFVIGVGHSK